MQVYDITKYGFLTDCSKPLDDYYKEWDNVPIKLLSTDKLTTLNDYKKAYSILSIVANKYIWDNNKVSLPKQIAIPLWEVSSYLGLPPVLTYASVNLYNWGFIEEECFDLENLKSINTITGTPDEEWFYLVMVSIEGEGGKILKDIYNLKTIMNDNKKTKDFLIKFNKVLDKCVANFSRMREKCSPHVYKTCIKKYFTGLNTLPYGIIYDGVSEEGLKFKGGPAAQSSLFQVFYTVLGIKHGSLMRDYMPKPHVDFIELIESYPSLKKSLNNENYSLYNDCVNKVKKFRKIHTVTVKDYVDKKYVPRNYKKKDTSRWSILILLATYTICVLCMSSRLTNIKVF